MNAQVTWYFEDQPIRRNYKYDPVVEGRVHRLVIKDVEGKDEGKYTIIAKNNKSSASLSINGG